MKKMTKRSILSILLAVVLAAAVSVAGTLAYIQSTANPVNNTFALAKLDTQLHEYLTDVDKRVTIENIGDSDAYIRARIMVSGVDPKNVEVCIAEPTTKEEGKVYLVMNHTTAAEWQKTDAAADGWYYWCATLKTGTSTAPLLDKVVMGSDLLGKVTVTVNHESVLAIGRVAGKTSASDIAGVFADPIV